MAFYTLNSGSPTSASFTLADRTLVQFSVLGAARPSGTSQVVLEVNASGTWRLYGISLDNDEPEDYNLAANEYRLRLSNPSDTTGNVVVSVSPNS